jgi:hypothetical protein
VCRVYRYDRPGREDLAQKVQAEEQQGVTTALQASFDIETHRLEQKSGQTIYERTYQH